MHFPPTISRALTQAVTGVLFCLLAACVSTPSTRASKPTPLLLVSIDALRPDYLERGLTPKLTAIAAEGVRAQWMTPSFPSQTFPNHYAMVTGLRPDHNGIVNNTMTDTRIPGVRFGSGNRVAVADARWWSQATPIWLTAKQRGLRTATVFWPGSEAPNHGIQPDDWLPYDKKVAANDRVDLALRWLARPPATRPDFATLYLDTIDIVGHDFGPDSSQMDTALRDVDATLGRLFDGIERLKLEGAINIVIVSDHGMAAVAPEHVIVLDDIIPLDSIETPIAGTVAGITPRRGYEAVVTQKVLSANAPWQCWRKADLPERLHYGKNARVPPLVCLCNEGWTTATRAWLANGRHVNAGSHGFDPDLPSMRATFIASGPAFAQGRVIAPFNNVDIYPLLARLLGVPALPGDGSETLIERVTPGPVEADQQPIAADGRQPS